MKKVVGIALLTLVLAACGASEAEGGGESRFEASGVYVIDDSITGCKYVLYDWDRAGGITPLLNAQGEPDCGNNGGVSE